MKEQKSGSGGNIKTSTLSWLLCVCMLTYKSCNMLLIVACRALHSLPMPHCREMTLCSMHFSCHRAISSALEDKDQSSSNTKQNAAGNSVSMTLVNSVQCAQTNCLLDCEFCLQKTMLLCSY